MGRIRKGANKVWTWIRGNAVWAAIVWAVQHGGVVLIPVVRDIWKAVQHQPFDYLYLAGELVVAAILTWLASRPPRTVPFEYEVNINASPFPVHRGGLPMPEDASKGRAKRRGNSN